VVINDKPATEAVGLLFDQMTRAAYLRQGAPELSTALAAATRSERLLDQLITPVSTTSESRDDLLEGYENLEQALAHDAGDAAAAPLLRKAQAALVRALVHQPRDPLPLMLLSSCHFNLAKLQTAAGDKPAAQRSVAAMHEALSQAYDERNRCRFEAVQREIMADHALLVSRNYQEAVELYGALTAEGEATPLPAALRAHWMLAGIHSGDWGVPADHEVVDAALARKHVIQILAHWPDSAEAHYLRRNLRWKEEDGTHFDHVPLEHTAVLTGR
jgi:hypothetical protein